MSHVGLRMKLVKPEEKQRRKWKKSVRIRNRHLLNISAWFPQCFHTMETDLKNNDRHRHETCAAMFATLFSKAGTDIPQNNADIRSA